MTRLDAFFAALYLGVVGTLVTLVLQGPELGLWGLGLPLFIAAISFIFGTAVVNRISGSTIPYDSAFRSQMWLFTAVSAFVLVVVCLVYKLYFLNERESFEGWLLLHFLVVFLCSTLARVMTFSANRALASSQKANDRAAKGTKTRLQNKD